jgi:hypothetical protein
VFEADGVPFEQGVINFNKPIPDFKGSSVSGPVA